MKTSRKIWLQKTHRRQSKSGHSNPCNRCIVRNKNGHEEKFRRWNHPDIQKYLKINKSKNFGRCIKAAQSIEAGKIAIVAKPFATAVKNTSNVPYCLTCHAIDVNFISCKKCSMAWFCHSRCRNGNLTHQYECGTLFHKITNLDAKCAIQIVFEAMTAFKKFQDLSRFIKKAFKDRDGIPLASDSKASRLDCIIKLQTGQFKPNKAKNEDREIVLYAYKMITTFPKVREYFQLERNKKGESILKQLLTHNVPAIAENCFHISLLTKNHVELDRILLYDILSYLNHSCSPNLINVIDGNVMTCIASQMINRDEQTFISYRPFEKETREKRQHALRNWDFECQCDRCEYQREINQAEYKRANKMDLKEVESKLNRPYDWTPQKGAYIIRYRRLLND